MALIKCPECNAEVSEKANTCPKCAYPLSAGQADHVRVIPEPKIIVKSKEGCFLQTLNIGCMIIAVIIGVIGLIVLIGLFGS